MPAGVLFALGAYALYACGDATIKGLGSGLSVYEIAFFTTLFSLIPAFLSTPKGESWWRFWRANNPRLLHLRGLSGVLGNLCVIYGFVSIPLNEVYSLAFLAPIFVALISIWLLAEKIAPQRWLLLAASFVGVLIVVRPGFRELHWGHLAATAAAVFGAITVTVLRRIARHEARATLIGVASAYILVTNGVLMIVTHSAGWPTWYQLAQLLAIGAFGGTANLLFIAATRGSPVSIIAPMQYSQLFWAIIFGALFFAEYPVPIAYVGLSIMVVAGILNVLASGTKIRFFSRLSPGGAGPSLLRESTRATDATLEAPIAGAPVTESED